MSVVPPEMPTLSKEDPPAYSNEDAVVLFSEFRTVPERSHLVPLRLPLCLPQGTAGSNAAFVRAYSPELQASGVEMNDWMHFVDGLNIAMSASPPLRVVEFAGMVVGFVPHHWAMIASAGIQFAAGTGIHVLSKTLTDRYLRRANAEYFAPRGLRVRICKTAAMRQLTGLDPVPDANEPTSAKVKKFAIQSGRVAETVVLHLPIIRKVYNRFAPSVPSIRPGAEGLGGVTARRLAMIEGHTLPLTFAVPPAPPEEGLMNKVSGLSVRLQTQRAGQKEAKIERKRQLLAIQEGRATSLTPVPSSDIGTSISTSSSFSSAQNVLGQATDWRQARKDRRAEQRALRRAKRGRVSRGLQSSVELADRMEWKTTRMLLWVVVLNAEQDEKIQGRELVDNDADVERVGEEEWQAELKHENAEDKEILEEVMKEEASIVVEEVKVDHRD
ncbi:hypothetical protein ACEPAF_6210 [Sanghuangporus sanghuang]